MQKWKAIMLVAAILVQSFYCPVMAREARFLETADRMVYHGYSIARTDPPHTGPG